MKKDNVILDTTSDRFADWKENFIADKEYDDIDISFMTDDDYWEAFYNDNRVWADELNDWFNEQIDGVIVAFANLDLWNGRFVGAKRMGRKLNDIIDTCGCDHIKLYFDRYDVKGNLYHHDGTNNLTYRFIPDTSNIDVYHILDLASNGKLTWEYFRKHTKSLKNTIKEILSR